MYCTSQYHFVLIILNLVYKHWNSFETPNLKAKISTLTRELFFDVLAKTEMLLKWLVFVVEITILRQQERQEY
jgi:hypothetical protein